MAIEVTQSKLQTTIAISGALDGSAIRAVEDRLLQLPSFQGRVELDVSRATSRTSDGLRQLVQLCRDMNGAGGGVTITGLPHEIAEALGAVSFLDPSARSSRMVPVAGQHHGGLRRVDVTPSHCIEGYYVRQGSPLPFGARVVRNGINFAIASSAATRCVLVLYEKDSTRPLAEITVPPEFRIGNVFAMFVFGLDSDLVEYAYRFDGPFSPHDGHRFDFHKLLIDPYARALTGGEIWQCRDARRPRYRGRVVSSEFDWGDERPPLHPVEDLVVYEMHVRGFTRHESSGARWAGTFAGIYEKIPHLKSLGINCIELMPVFEFDECDNVHHHPETGEPLLNFWGYNTVGFFAPKANYAATGPLGLQADEFKSLIKRLHEEGIEVLLDVVFNHTAEGNENGPTISFRGIDNRTYYLLGPQGEYLNYSGTGNTLNCNHPVVREMVLECLRYWVSHYHIDGFRFDLASILGRGANGEPLSNPPLLEALAHDPVLANVKLIAEAWDAAGLYQVGSFPDYGRWAEWNGRYRDCVRRFLKGDAGQVEELSHRLAGSPDLYADRGPSASVNYVTCHDGFTLMDLVSYNEKHNWANGEESRDGLDQNHSWNCGVEGPTSDPDIVRLRRQQIKNAITILLVSQGVPMILMGDEMGRTQDGNNNAYCHDGPLTWLDWSLREKNDDLFDFARRMIAFRRAHPALRHSLHHSAAGTTSAAPIEISWHGVRAGKPDWSFESRSLGMMLRLALPNAGWDFVYVAFNMFWEDLDFELPALPMGFEWRLFIDTADDDDAESVEPGREKRLVDQKGRAVSARSCVVLVGRPG